MIRINLLPLRASRRLEAVKTELVMVGLLGVAALIVLTGVFVVYLASANTLESENVHLAEDLKKKEALRVEVEEMEKLRVDLEQKLAVIEQLKANKVGPVLVLSDLSDATPEKLQLVSLVEKEGVVKLTGLASTPEVISQFLTNLEKSERFADVALNGIEQVDVDGHVLKEFSVTARVVLSEPPPAAAGGAAPKAPATDEEAP